MIMFPCSKLEEFFCIFSLFNKSFVGVCSKWFFFRFKQVYLFLKCLSCNFSPFYLRVLSHLAMQLIRDKPMLPCWLLAPITAIELGSNSFLRLSNQTTAKSLRNKNLLSRIGKLNAFLFKGPLYSQVDFLLCIHIFCVVSCVQKVYYFII